MSDRTTIVVGAGIAGLYTALRLAERGDRVTVVDAEPAVGGLTKPWEIGGVTWDRFYHVVLGSDVQTRRLLGEIGLEDRLTFKPVKTNFYFEGRLYPFSSLLDLLTFPELSIVGKLRLIATILHARHFGNDAAYEWEGVLEYLMTWSGAATVERVWRPLLRAKLGEQYAMASAAFIRATIKRLQGARRGGFREERYGYVRGGYATVLSALEAHLRKLGVEFVLGHRVKEVSLQDERVIVTLAGTELIGDRAVLTVASPLCVALCPQFTPAEQRALMQDRYFGVVCTSLLVNRHLSDAYVTNVADASFPFTGIINMGALVDRAVFHGCDLVYLPKYAPADEKAFTQSDDALIARSIESLRRVFPAFSPRDVVAARVARARHVFPFPRIGRAATLPPATTSLRRIAVVNNARLRYATLNVSDTIGVVDEALQELEQNSGWRSAREARGHAFAGSR